MVDNLTTLFDQLIHQGKKICFLSDFDGTLAPFSKDPSGVRFNKQAREGMRSLDKHKNIDVMILTGRSVNDMEHLIGEGVFDIIGSHGLERKRKSEKGIEYVPLTDTEKQFDIVLRHYASTITDASMRVLPKIAGLDFKAFNEQTLDRLSNEIIPHLQELLLDQPTFSMHHESELEVDIRHNFWNKGTGFQHFVATPTPYDYYIFAGDTILTGTDKMIASYLRDHFKTCSSLIAVDNDRDPVPDFADIKFQSVNDFGQALKGLSVHLNP